MPNSTQNTKELIGLVIAAANAVHAAGADGKVDLADLGQLLPLVPKIGPAVENIGQIPAELADLDQSEADELIAMIKKDLQVGDDHVKAIIAASFKMIAAGVELFQALKVPSAQPQPPQA